MNEPSVSVCMVTFNHERFVAQAIESVVRQKTDFPFELIIGEDCSTDGTRGICEMCARRYPDLIRLLPSERNLGMHANGRRTLQACRGECIAFCEGDDYWTDSSKLQRQADHMAGHSGCACCFHNAMILRNREEYPWFAEHPDHADQHCPPARPLTAADLICGNVMPTVTAMYRREALAFRPAWVDDVIGVDWATSVLATQAGSLDYLPYTMSVYRADSGGAWSGRCGRKRWAATLHQMDLHEAFLGKEYAEAFTQGRKFVIREMQRDAVHLAKRLCLEDPDVARETFRQHCDEAVVVDHVHMEEAWRRGREAAFYDSYWAGRRGESRRLLRRWLQAEPTAVFNRHVLSIATELWRKR